MKNALISVYDKDGVAGLAGFLAGSGWNIISTGGTAAFLRQAGIKITDVSEITGFPECLDGRVKTLHPAIHAGILARRQDKTHTGTLAELKLQTIDLVCVNLYPFFEKAGAGLSLDETIEFIDIGGPSMLRSAAKNWRDVIVLCDTGDYNHIIEKLKTGTVDPETRRLLAGKVFNLTSAYDAAIARYMLAESNDLFPHWWTVPWQRGQGLRYGENSHQQAALYHCADHAGMLGAMEILGGKELSYNNIRDFDLAWKCVCAFGLEADGTAPLGHGEVQRLLPGVSSKIQPACVAVKHNTPCGIALGGTALEAFLKTYACDPVSIFGGIVAYNTVLTEEAARAMDTVFLEIVIAPEYETGALTILQAKKNLRIIKLNRAPHDTIELVSVDGGLLAQQTNRRLLETWQTLTRQKVDPALLDNLIFALRAVTFVKSNGIVVAENCAAAGIGGGETNRIAAAELAIQRALQNTDGAEHQRVLASDAFFPFPDVVEAAARAGIKAIVQSGGSAADSKSIEACDKYGIPMVFTGVRYFKH